MRCEYEEYGSLNTLDITLSPKELEELNVESFVEGIWLERCFLKRKINISIKVNHEKINAKGQSKSEKSDGRI